MAELRFGVLGTPEVSVAGRTVRIPPGRRRAVLACLLVRAGQPVSADALIEAAWGSDLPRDARSALHTVVSRLRAQLGNGAIEAVPHGYRLRVPSNGLDADAFEELLDRARPEEPVRSRALLAEALGLWRGAAYGEYADSPFATVEATRLEALRLEAIEAHAEAGIECGEPAAVVPALEAMLTGQPFRERAVELLMLALYHSGRQADALARFDGYRVLLAEELGLDPSPALTDLQQQILGHGVPPVRAGPAQVPTWLDTSTAFVGREAEVAGLVDAATTNRLTVVTGPAGVGKSRLTAEALPLLHGRLGSPVTVTELAGVPPGRAAAAVADALGVRAVADAPADVAECLGALPHILVLDGCEHLHDELRPLLSLIARRCRQAHVLATSRRRLGVASELVFPVAPLPVPDATDTVPRQQATASVRLVADRLRRLRPTFALTPASLGQVADLCRRLDGLPLALELAASRAATIGVAEVVARLPALLEGDADVLRGGLEWSYQLLGPEERRLLRVLSVFPGEFAADAVRGVTAALPGWNGDATRALAELVESSLVVSRPDGAGLRHRLLAVVRSFAAERLDAEGQGDEARLAHATWVCGTTTDVAADWPRLDGALVGSRLTDLAGDIAAAVRWSLEAERTRLAAGIADAVMRCLHWTPGADLRDLLVETAERACREPSPDVAGGVAAGAMFSAERGDLGRARRLGLASLAMSADPDRAPTAWLAVAVAALYSGDHDEARRCFRRMAAVPPYAGEGHTSLALISCYADDIPAAEEHAAVALAAAPSGSDASRAFARYAAGEVVSRSDPARGAELLAEAADEADRVGAEQVSRVARVALFASHVRNGRHAEATALGLGLLGDLRRRGVWPQTWTTMRVAAELLAYVGRPADAAYLLGAAAADPSAPQPTGQDVGRYAALEEELSARLGPRVRERIGLLAAGTPRARVLSRAEQALATARAERGDAGSAVQPPT